MAEKYVVVPLGDDRAREIGDVISNKTSKKILDFLSEREGSSGDISKQLGLPISTVEYNLKKLVSSGLVLVGKVLWSVKGRKVEIYKLSRKMILIGTKEALSSKLRKVIPVVFATILVSFFLKYYYSVKDYTLQGGERLNDAMITTAKSAPSTFLQAQQPIWLWFLLGSLFALIVYFIWNWKRE